ncbi:hypothetical protein ccbrp13_47860 [Ktedonobacteria bacterium brp13]|nr:hypothetical protein ccbrp13_47860 [Ktedonobacteria bacterium brp13]
METTIRHAVEGVTFGARGCSSCTCDPCDCNPCTCGDNRTPSYPEWRVSGCALTSGTVNGVNVAQQYMLSLTQPVKAGIYTDWYSVLLLPEEASEEQCEALLAVFESTLNSWPAEAGDRPALRSAVYQTRIGLQFGEENAGLSVRFDPQKSRLIRTGDFTVTPRIWTYKGEVALRDVFNTGR